MGDAEQVVDKIREEVEEILAEIDERQGECGGGRRVDRTHGRLS